MKSNRTMKVKINKKRPDRLNLSGYLFVYCGVILRNMRK